MPPRLVVVGASLGGMKALRMLLGALPPDFPAALAVVLHRPPEESQALLPALAPLCALPIGFPLDKERIAPGQVYIAPPNYHLLVEDGHFAFTLDAPEYFARPSIDALFESAADAFGAAAIGIVLSGAGQDGASGLAAIRRRGGQAMVQSPREAQAPEMPLAALAAVRDAGQFTLVELATWLASMTHSHARKSKP